MMATAVALSHRGAAASPGIPGPVMPSTGIWYVVSLVLDGSRLAVHTY